VNQPGKLFTIIGRHTFSAAMNCLNRMKLNTDDARIQLAKLHAQ